MIGEEFKEQFTVDDGHGSEEQQLDIFIMGELREQFIERQKNKMTSGSSLLTSMNPEIYDKFVRTPIKN
jgi:hypothetical protein